MRYHCVSADLLGPKKFKERQQAAFRSCMEGLECCRSHTGVTEWLTVAGTPRVARGTSKLALQSLVTLGITLCLHCGGTGVQVLQSTTSRHPFIYMRVVYIYIYVISLAQHIILYLCKFLRDYAVL